MLTKKTIECTYYAGGVAKDDWFTCKTGKNDVWSMC